MQFLSVSPTLDIVGHLQLHAAGHRDDERLKRLILCARFYAQAPEHPGFVASPTPTGPVIAVFTSERRLAGHAGAVRCFSTTGADLVSRAPVGHCFVIDPGTPHEFVVDPAAFMPVARGAAG